MRIFGKSTITKERVALFCLKSQKHHDEIWPVIKSQPLPREIVIVYTIYFHNSIIKDLSRRKIYWKEIHYVINSYQPNHQTRRYNGSTKIAVCGQSGFSIPNLHLIILAPIMHIFALTWKDWINLKAYKASYGHDIFSMSVQFEKHPN